MSIFFITYFSLLSCEYFCVILSYELWLIFRRKIKEERELKGFCKKEPDASTSQESEKSIQVPPTCVDLETADNINKQKSSVDCLPNVSENKSTNDNEKDKSNAENVVKDSEATRETVQTSETIMEVGQFYHHNYTKGDYAQARA